VTLRSRLLSNLLFAAAIAVGSGCAAPSIVDVGATGSATPTGTATGSPTGNPTPSSTPAGGSLCGTTSSTTIQGGTLDCLSFAIVGDTRPPAIDDTSGYPKAVITKIYQDLENAAARPSFAISTGDYQFSSPTGSQAATQLGYYLQAQAGFQGMVYHAMGNHECTGATNSNCVGSAATNNNFDAFKSKMMSPLGLTKPYYTVRFDAPDASWSAKFVFVAANAWDAAQATWLQTEMAKPTTYTFVVRHEGNNASTAPGVTPSKQIIASYPYTALLVGHTHTFSYDPAIREVVTGIGGAPLTGSINYGYVMVRQRTDGAVDFNVYDYQSGASVKHFVMTKTGTETN
jgi:hypothetical protein